MVTEGIKTAVVTGAGRGIGRAVAEGLMQRGWQVVLAGRSAGPLEELAQAWPGLAIAHPADVSKVDQVDALMSRAAELAAACGGRLDLLFNNAGVFPRTAHVDELEAAEWEEAVSINLTGAFWCARAAFREMRRQSPQGGRIINNGSISAHAPRPQAAGYTVTKHAITGLTKQLSLDGRAFGIACSQIDIGNVASDMTAAFSAGPGALQADGSRRPEPRMGMEQVVQSVCLMAEMPPEANVQFMTVMASAMPFIGRG